MTWTRNLKTVEEKERFENSLRGAKIVLDRLVQILDEEEKDIDFSETSINTYETPNWASKQAHKNGQRAALRKIKQLVSGPTERK